MTAPDGIVPIPSAELALTWRTLMAIARNYDMGSVGEASLIEARRLVEVEIRAQHGDDVWADVCERTP